MPMTSHPHLPAVQHAAGPTRPLRLTRVPRRVRGARCHTAALVLATSVAACSGPDTSASPWTVRDSAGITIVESSAPVSEAWVAGAPEVQIGVVEGDPAYQFQFPGHAALLASGQILVAEGGANELRVFDEGGRHVRSFGRSGSGPGEFEFLSDFQLLRADSILVVDYNARRVSVFAPDGDLLTVTPIENPTHIPGGRLPDGRFYRHVSLRADGDLDLGLHRDSSAWLAAELNATAVDTLVRLPGSEVLFIESASGGPARTAAIPRPFGLRQQMAFRADSLVQGDGSAAEVTVRDLAGRPVRILRWQAPDAAMTDAIREGYREQMEARVRNPEQRRNLQVRMENLPDRVPAFDRLLVVEDGQVLVRSYLIPGDTVGRWTVLAPDGHWERDVVLPARFEPTHVRGGRMVGTWWDESDVPYIRVYRLPE